MRTDIEVIIPIPKAKTYKGVVTVNGVDVSGDVLESEWIKPLLNIGVGTFRIKLNNNGSKYGETFIKGHAALYYADNADGDTLQFYGRVDHVQEIIEKKGHYIEIIGRHRSYRCSEVRIAYSGSGYVGTVFKAAIAEDLTEYTTSNVATTDIETDVEWTMTRFIECVQELVEAGVDIYVDDNLDFHLFEADSITNSSDWISEGYNFLKLVSWGTDDYYEKSRVTVQGQDENGLPIIYTAKIANESDIREEFVKDTSLSTLSAVQERANSRLLELTNRPPQGVIMSMLLWNTNPGDNIPIVLPRNKVVGYYKVLQIKHLFGMKYGLPQTEVTMEKETSDTSKAFKTTFSRESRLTQVDMTTKYTNSYNLVFNDESEILTSTGVIVEDGVLKLDSGETTGTMKSVAKTADQDITKAEIRIDGTDLGASSYRLTCNNEATWFTAARKTPISVDATDQGILLKIEVTLVQDATNANPQINSISILFK